MPTVTVKRDELFQAIGQTFTEEEFDDLCFRFGIELDDVIVERSAVKLEEGAETVTLEEVKYKIELPANRYDLLCLEGLARALRIFLEREDAPTFRTVAPAKPERIVVDPSVLEVRPFVVCAILRNVTFTPSSYASFIDLQDKLHQNICRQRTLVSIGTHDLDTIKGPFSYQARKPEEIKFIPLNDTRTLNGAELMEDLATGHLKEYLAIIKDKPRYPVIYDATGVVLSLPPIINGDHSKIRLETTNVFIEVTAKDLTKASVVLNIMVAMFSQYSQNKFTVEAVETVDSTGKSSLYPDLSYREEKASVEYVNGAIGVNLSTPEIVALLRRMGLSTKATDDGKEVIVSVPPTRSDIIHACDIMEDVAIAYGYNNLKLTVPSTYTVGKQQPVNKFTDLLRNEVAQAGYTEIFTFSLCAKSDNFELLRRKDDGSAVILSNPSTQEFQVGRVNLLVGGLKTLNSNSAQPLPLRVFEISDVMLQDSASDVGAVNRRRLCALYSNTSSGFEVIHGLLDRVMLALGIPMDKEHGYSITASEDEAFFPGRRADVLWKGNKVGVFGIVHPVVLANYDLKHPVTALEIDLEPFLERKMARATNDKEKEKEKEK